MEDYWHWKKTRAASEGSRAILERAQATVEGQFWRAEHLKAFKAIFRNEYWTARHMAAIRGGRVFARYVRRALVRKGH